MLTRLALACGRVAVAALFVGALLRLLLTTPR
jgi:hypothetical protein